MKRCPTCQQTYTDETLKFCRVDGALLVNDSAAAESATLNLSPSPASDAVPTQLLPTDTAQTGTSTSSLDASEIKSQPGETREARSQLRVEHILGGIKEHKLAALIALIVIVAGILGLTVYLRARSSEVAIDS